MSACKSSLHAMLHLAVGARARDKAECNTRAFNAFVVSSCISPAPPHGTSPLP